ncbi:GNAT family N-acetyltransferase [Blastococcus sp. TF02-9]|uniref:GNAT family N-acetyltransferase n=1 Tax=Blastococcus sp. TF02-09 TaxID=2250576 RepID=UPI001314655E|nr:GNAT family N-acetyltransferase [Blastococcus sp. TF02-9]
MVGPEDWRRWRRLRLAALEQAPEAFAERLAAWTGRGDTETRWRARLTDMPFNLVLTVDGSDAGMVSATRRDADGRITLTSLWVAPWARGLGIGDIAVQAVQAWAAERGGCDVVLSVRATNAAAIALYRRNGLVDIGRSPRDPHKRLMRCAGRTGRPDGHGE